MITLEEATSRCWAEVDLSRLALNYRNALAHLQPGVTLICVLKADAYGLGAKVVAQRLWREGARYFAVASYNEAWQIKSALPESQILILGLVGSAQLQSAMESNMILTVFSQKSAKEIISAARALDKPARVHIKLETGLNRLGIAPADAPQIAQELLESGCVRVEGLFTHLALRNAASDRAQLQLLYDCRARMSDMGIKIAMTHALDSIGMVRYPFDQLDAVRTGAWLYGVYPRGYAHPEESQLAMTVKARVALLHRARAGAYLGYDETHPLKRDSVIATLSCGYIDGYPRLNSAGEVELRGQRAPVVGLVCMDQMMVDVTDIKGAQEGDEVTLLGGGIGIDEYATWGNLNRNESLARTGKRVPRVYLEDDHVVEIVDGLE